TDAVLVPLAGFLGQRQPLVATTAVAHLADPHHASVGIGLVESGLDLVLDSPARDQLRHELAFQALIDAGHELIGMHECNDGIRSFEDLARPHRCGIIVRIAEELRWCRVMSRLVRPRSEIPDHPQAGGDRYWNNDHPRCRGLCDAQRHVGREIWDNEAQHFAPVELGPLQLHVRLEGVVVVHAVAMAVEEFHVAEDQQSEQEGDRHEAHPDVWQGGTGDDDERPGYAEGPPEHSGRLMLRVVLSKLLFADLEHSISVATAPDTTSRDAGSLIAGEVMTRWGTGFSFTVTHNDDAVRSGLIHHTKTSFASTSPSPGIR